MARRLARGARRACVSMPTRHSRKRRSASRFFAPCPRELADEERKSPARRGDPRRYSVLRARRSTPCWRFAPRHSRAAGGSGGGETARQAGAARRETAALRARAERALHEAEETMRQGDEALVQAEWQVENLRAEFGAAGEPEFLAARFSAREAAEREIKAQAEQSCSGRGWARRGGARASEAKVSTPTQRKSGLPRSPARARSADLAREIFAEQRAKKAEWAALQESAGAEAAIFARESARADIHEQARRWAVLKLAALLVDAGLDRHRAERKDPLLARAGALVFDADRGALCRARPDFRRGRRASSQRAPRRRRRSWNSEL